MALSRGDVDEAVLFAKVAENLYVAPDDLFIDLL